MSTKVRMGLSSVERSVISQHTPLSGTSQPIWWRFFDPNNAAAAQELMEELAQAAGFASAAEQAEVERAAVAFVTSRYRADGWGVESVEAQCIGYDLDCVRGHERRHVEVKGVSGTVPGFMLTEGERKRAEQDPLWREKGLRVRAYTKDAVISFPRLTLHAGDDCRRCRFSFPISHIAVPRKIGHQNPFYVAPAGLVVVLPLLVVDEQCEGRVSATRADVR
jgi:hypothetical protein